MEEDAGAQRMTSRGTADSSAVAISGSPPTQTRAEAGDTETPAGTSGPGPEGASDPAANGSPVTDTEGADDGAANAPQSTDTASARPAAPQRHASRLTQGWLIAITVALVLLAGATGTGGYLALRAHRATAAIDRANTAAVVAAKDCIAATQPPDAAALPAAQQKLNDCSTRAFGAQIAWYAAIMAEAYHAVNVRVQVPDMRAAVERDNDDGSIIVLVAFRTKISQSEMPDRENSYRVRVKMVPEDGQFKIAELDQVGK